MDISFEKKCTNVTFNEKLNMHTFLGVKIQEATKELVRKWISLRHPEKIEIAELLCNDWMLYREDTVVFRVKHIPSGRTNTLYQILLSGTKNDGVYELSFKNADFYTHGIVLDGRHVLRVNSKGNYDVAVFKPEDGGEPESICRIDFESDEEFCDKLLSYGLVTEEELSLYYKPDDLLLGYIERKLPRVVFTSDKM